MSPTPHNSTRPIIVRTSASAPNRTSGATLSAKPCKLAANARMKLAPSSSAANGTNATGSEASVAAPTTAARVGAATLRSEEHTSELQSHSDLVCRLLLEKKKKKKKTDNEKTKTQNK